MIFHRLSPGHFDVVAISAMAGHYARHDTSRYRDFTPARSTLSFACCRVIYIALPRRRLMIAIFRYTARVEDEYASFLHIS